MNPAKLTVLVIDDDPALVQLASIQLRLLGHGPVVAEHGAAALPLLDEHRPDVILCDVMMPVMNGVAFCEALRSDSRHRDLPVILVTALPHDSSEVRGILELGNILFLGKPYDIEALRLALAEVAPISAWPARASSSQPG